MGADFGVFKRKDPHRFFQESDKSDTLRLCKTILMLKLCMWIFFIISTYSDRAIQASLMRVFSEVALKVLVRRYRLSQKRIAEKMLRSAGLKWCPDTVCCSSLS